jgi:signal transduction histidine kinase/CHASE3 domain sensor protein
MAFLFTLAILAAVALTSQSETQQLIRAMNWVAHTYEVIDELESMQAALENSIGAQRAYVLSGDERHLVGFNKANAALQKHFQRAAALTADNLPQHERLDFVQKLVDQRMQFARQVISIRREKGFQAAVDLAKSSQSEQAMETTEKISNLVLELEEKEKRLLDVRAAALGAACQRAMNIEWLLGGIALVLLVVAFVSSARSLAEGERAAERAKTQYEVVRLLSEHAAVEDAQTHVMETVCLRHGWQLALGWIVNKKTNTLVLFNSWFQPDLNLGGLLEEVTRLSFERGVGLPGRVWDSGKPLWLSGGEVDSTFPLLKVAGKFGLLSAVGFPVLGKDEVLGVITFLRRGSSPPEPELIPALYTIGSQLGLFIERKESETRVSEFYSTVSHELRSPLTSIRGSLGLIEGGTVGDVPAEALEMVNIARSNCDRLIRLINEILDLKKIEAGKLQLTLRTIDPVEIVSEALEGLKSMADQSGIVLKQEILCMDKINVDHDRLIQVLTNLVSNAIKFSERAGEIDVRVYKSEGYLRFSVIDHGPGIGSEQMHKLFGKFQQLDSSDSRRQGGTGLGLAISKSIVELHGGNIGVDSEVGKGSTFWFEIPLAELPAATRLS